MRRISKYILLFLTVFSLFSPGKIAYADDINDIKEFNGLTGDGKYLGEQYKNNYDLDIEETNIFDTIDQFWNDAANGIFFLIRMLADVTVSAFYIVMDLDIADMFSGQIQGIQEALNNSIFEPLFLLAFCATAGMIILYLFRRNMVGILGELGKVLLVLVLSMLIVKESGPVLSACTGITKSVSVQALVDLNNDAGTEQEEGEVSVSNFAANAAGVVWANLVHEPWKTLEFDNTTPTTDEIDAILKEKSGSPERKTAIKNYMNKGEKEAAALNKKRGMKRFWYLFVYLFILIAKAGIFLILSLFQLIFQVVAIFFVFLAPVILLLTMVPGYGMDTLTGWLKKILESQLNLFAITFVLGLAIKIDSLFANFGRQYGWFMGLIFQTGAVVGLFLYRDKLLQGLTTIQKGISNKGYARNRLNRAGTVDFYKGKEGVKRTAIGAKRITEDGVDKIQEAIEKIRPSTTDIFTKAAHKEEKQEQHAKRPTTTTGSAEQKGILYNSLKKSLSVDQESKEQPMTNNKVIPIRHPAEKEKEPERPTTKAVDLKKAPEQQREPERPVITQSKMATPGIKQTEGEEKKPERPVTTTNKVVPIKQNQEEKRERPRPSTKDFIKKVQKKELEQVPAQPVNKKNTPESVPDQKVLKNKEISQTETKREPVRPVTVPKEVKQAGVLSDNPERNVQKAQKPIKIKKVDKTTSETKKQVIRANTGVKRAVLKKGTTPVRKIKVKKKIG